MKKIVNCCHRHCFIVSHYYLFISLSLYICIILRYTSALNEWRACGSEKEKFAWCQRNCIAHARMRSLDSTARNLNSRLSTGLSELKKGRRKGEEKGSGTHF